MSDDLTNAIEKLQNTLSREGGIDELKNMVGGLLGASPSEDTAGDDTAGKNVFGGDEAKNPFDAINPEVIFKIKKIYDGMNSTDDPRSRLLLALKPYMNARRTSGIDNALRILNITKISSLIKDL